MRRSLAARDRLRLDVAVSNGAEMYSWHADRSFSSTFLRNVVRDGPIGSGGFVGFLENIFGQRDVRFRYLGRQTEGTAAVFTFEYTVPMSASHYEVQSGKHKKLVPFHGSFSAYVNTYELASMTVIADEIPKAIGICSSRNQIAYQLANVAGNELLLPREWTLGLTTPGLSTTSRSEYTACREFATEATISYKNLATSPADDTTESAPPQVLPAGLRLRIRLQTPIDGERSYAGDPVRGELLKSVTFGKQRAIMPRGAALSGVITRLAEGYLPSAHFLINIEFERMRTGNRTFILRARHIQSPEQMADLRWIFGRGVPIQLIEDVERGALFFPSKRLHLGKRFSSYWITEPVVPSH